MKGENNMQLELLLTKEGEIAEFGQLPREHCIDILTLLYEHSTDWGRLGFELLHDTEPRQPAAERFCTRLSVKLAEL